MTDTPRRSLNFVTWKWSVILAAGFFPVAVLAYLVIASLTGSAPFVSRPTEFGEIITPADGAFICFVGAYELLATLLVTILRVRRIGDLEVAVSDSSPGGD
jgi:hypothetical protein